MKAPLRSYDQLKTDLSFTHNLPVTADWSAAADFLFLIKDHCLAMKPANIMECSSGLTTLILARCCQLNGGGKVFSLENGKEFAQQTEENLSRFGLEAYADVIHAPLEEVIINSEVYKWYEIKNLPDIDIDMLVIDGPPGFIQKHSRLPALPLLFNRLLDGSQVFLDDAGRDEEKEITGRWLATMAGLKHEYIETERGCSVLSVKK
ncbi:hypothetical protein MNBD_GAMMA11-2879 [hydrothermal vent metagenome]|uniref:Class I SAM-dependent methyltransferase n=1 Tax=hydrothermal vent metagenome TaxID=652676 RepID=A0A3B0X3D4_9ZZZZ